MVDLVMLQNMSLETPEILPDETKEAPPPAPGQTEKTFVQTKPGAPAIPIEIWKKMSEEEKKRVGEDGWREQA